MIILLRRCLAILFHGLVGCRILSSGLNLSLVSDECSVVRGFFLLFPRVDGEPRTKDVALCPSCERDFSFCVDEDSLLSAMPNCGAFSCPEGNVFFGDGFEKADFDVMSVSCFGDDAFDTPPPFSVMADGNGSSTLHEMSSLLRKERISFLASRRAALRCVLAHSARCRCPPSNVL